LGWECAGFTQILKEVVLIVAVQVAAAQAAAAAIQLRQNK
jgi:hypothetical protein